MHRVLVEERKWIDEPRILNALNFCMLLPGPEAMQLATYVGWRLHGMKGGLAAGLLFVVPGALVVLALSMLYAAFGKLPAVEALFVGVKAAVLAIVVEALLRIARRSLKDSVDWIDCGRRLRRDLLPGRAVPAHRAGGGAVRLLARERRASGQRPRARAERPADCGRWQQSRSGSRSGSCRSPPSPCCSAARTCCRSSPGSSPSSRW